MADKSISELIAATTLSEQDLFVAEQSGTAKKVTGQLFTNWLTNYADGHGGIQSISKTGTSGLVDTYTITYADTTTGTFTVTNGAKGDTGNQTYVWIKWAPQQPTADNQMSSLPDKWIGIYVGLASTAPSTYTSYTWYQYKGDKGDTGDPAEIDTSRTSVSYQIGDYGSVIPSGEWTALVPSPDPGKYLWTRTIIAFNDESPITLYSVSHYGVDGSGAVATVNNVSPDGNHNVTITADDIGTDDSDSVQDHIDAIDTALGTKENKLIYKSVSISAASTSQQIGSVTDTAITSDTNVVWAEIVNPEYQTSDWTVTTYDTSPQLRVVGTSSASTTLKLILAEV